MTVSSIGTCNLLYLFLCGCECGPMLLLGDRSYLYMIGTLEMGMHKRNCDWLIVKWRYRHQTRAIEQLSKISCQFALCVCGSRALTLPVLYKFSMWAWVPHQSDLFSLEVALSILLAIFHFFSAYDSCHLFSFHLSLAYFKEQKTAEKGSKNKNFFGSYKVFRIVGVQHVPRFYSAITYSLIKLTLHKLLWNCYLLGFNFNRNHEWLHYIDLNES